MKFSVSSGIMGDECFYQDYILPELNSETKYYFQNAFDINEYAEYYAIQLPTNSPVHYHEVFFFDIYNDTGYYCPVFKTMINGSSGYAMCRSGMDRDDESETLEWSVDEMVDRVPNEWKECVRNFFN